MKSWEFNTLFTQNTFIDIFNAMKNKNIIERTKLIPFILAIVIIIIDQITKSWVVKNIPLYINTDQPYNVYKSFFGGFINIIHVRNLGVAFSIGYSWPTALRKIVFSVIPLAFIAYVIYLCIKTDDVSDFQRWCISAVVGGGIGNIIDRIFRSEGVVDFVDVKWFGWEDAWFDFLRWDRWPTFNFADAMIVVFGAALIVSLIIMYVKADKKQKGKK